MILRNDHPERTPETCHTLLQDQPWGRLNNIRVPMAAKLQPPSQLGKRRSHNALAQSLGKNNHHDCHCRTNTRGIPLTRQSIRQKRSQQVPTKARRGPHNQPEGGHPSSPRLQNLPTIPRPRHQVNRIPGGTPPQRIYLRIELAIRRTILLHQEKGWEALTCPRLPKTEQTNNTGQLPPPPDQNDLGTAPRTIPIHQVRYTMGIQQHSNQRRQRMEGRL